jgi:hypothetical protein
MIHKGLLFGLVVLLAAGTAQVRADSDHSKVIQGRGNNHCHRRGAGACPRDNEVRLPLAGRPGKV